MQEDVFNQFNKIVTVFKNSSLKCKIYMPITITVSIYNNVNWPL